jgi:hypothetical protein
MEHNEMEPQREPESRHSFSKAVVASLIIIWIAAGALGGYAVHEHSVAQSLKLQNQQTDATLAATRNQVDDLTSRVNALATQIQTQAQPEPQAQPQSAPAASAPSHHVASTHRSDSSRWKKMQSQLDAQNKAIEDTRNQIAQTQGDLSNTRTELTGSIARTHDELVLLEKKGERNYYEFDIDKSKSFQHDGPVGVRLRKANSKHEYADLELIVDDRTVSQKHVNLYQPVMFSTPDSPQPLELVINNITKDHIHGYVSAPKYRQSELASMSSANSNGTAAANGAAATGATSANPAPARQQLPAPQ